MDDAQRRVAVGNLVDQHAQRVDVVDLLELGALALHLSPDAADVLGPARDVGLDAGLLERLVEHDHGSLDERLALAPMRLELLGQAPVGLGLEHLEGQVLELPLDLPDAQPLGQRRIDLGSLARNALLLLGRQGRDRAHVVQPIGQLDEHDADVLRHRQQHLANVLGLLLLVAAGTELGQLGDAVDECCDLRPETLLDVGQREVGVLGHVVQQRGLDGFRVEAEVGQRARDRKRVADVRLAAHPALGAVRLDGELPRVAHAGKVGAGIVLGEHLLDLALGRVQRSAAVTEGQGAADSLTRPTRTAPLRGTQGLNRHLRCSVT